MELVRERTIEQERVISKEEQEHNARISERYLKLKNAVEDQFATVTPETTAQTSVYTSDVSMQTPTFGYTPTVEQRPQVTEYIRNLRHSVFTSEAFTLSNTNTQQEVTAETVAPTVSEVSYSLSTMAKAVLACFAAVVVGLMSMICVNSHTLAQQSTRIHELQAYKQELTLRHAEVEERIAEAKSEETIRQYAESQGMVRGE